MSDTPKNTNPDEAAAMPAPANRRRRTALMVSLPAAILIGAGAWYMTAGGVEKTDNAYLHQARLAVAAELSGRVSEVAVHDNQTVKAGDLLFRIDPEPYQIALDKAKVGLDAARLNVQTLKAAYAEAVAQAKIAEDNAQYEASNLTRQQALTAKGVGTGTALEDAQHAEMSAREAATAARISVDAALAALGGNATADVDDHPQVRAAQVALDAANYDLKQTEIRAAADGTIYQAASFRPGQMVAPGATLFTLVETKQAWVEANFKETQLSDLLVGQQAEVVLDAARNVTLSGKVESIGAGTGAEFSLLPAQNATGNWVKVEQRVPVRIALDDAAMAPLLATGLSAEVSVTTGPSNGAAMAATLMP